MDYLKEGIGLRAMAQRDPLVEYQREGFDMFAAMLDSLKEESVGFLYNLQVQVVPAGEQPQPAGVAAGAPNGAAPVVTAASAAATAISNGGASRRRAGRRGGAGSRSAGPGPPPGGQAHRAVADRAGGGAARQGTRRAAAGRAADLQRPAGGRWHRDPAFGRLRRRRPPRLRDRDGGQGTRPQRAVPVRIGQEVQAVSRPPRSRLIEPDHGVLPGVHPDVARRGRQVNAGRMTAADDAQHWAKQGIDHWAQHGVEELTEREAQERAELGEKEKPPTTDQ